MKKSNWFVIIAFILILISGVIIIVKPGQQSWTPETFQEIVQQHYLTESGKIRSYGTPYNDQYLLESSGLYMEWLDQQQLTEELMKQVETVENEFFIQVNDGAYLTWEINGEDRAHTNAWIDDARVVDYLQSSEDIVRSIEKDQIKNGLITDFYDWKHQQSSNRVVLSYGMSGIVGLKLDATRMLYQQVSESDQIFYDEYYLVNRKAFDQADEVHMVDQLLIALELEKLDIENDRFWQWLQEEWNTTGVISGRYNRDTTEGNTTESGAVYGIAAELAEAKGSNDLAKKWREKGRALVYREDGEYGDVHFFDLVWNAP